MPKMKTHRGAAKRFRVIGSGKFKRKKAYRSHMMGHKTTKQKRGLRARTLIHAVDEVHIKRLLPYSVK
jgi:large subunit ribosomal protein L35